MESITDEEKALYSYGWVDEKAGTVRIPIERAMDLIAQRGFRCARKARAATSAAPTAHKLGIAKKGEKK